MNRYHRFLLVGVSVLALVSVHAATAAVVINEVDYDQPGTDFAEFIELYNSGPGSVDLSAYTLELWNGSTTTLYQSFPLSGVLAEGAFFVICGGTTQVPNCDLDVTPDSNLIQNGAPDAVALVFNGSVVDALSYEGDVPGAVEGTGATADTGANFFEGLSRYPDGADTDNNAADFFVRCATPGEANAPAGIVCEDPIPNDAESWSHIKAMYR